MTWDVRVLTLFPEMFPGPLGGSLAGKALSEGRWSLQTVNIRDFAADQYGTVDDAPFGGGPGMVMRPGPLAAALDPLAGTHRVLFTPAGAPLDQPTLDRWAALPALTLVCGRYEGVDERIAEHLVDEEASLGDFVLMGGEAAALAVIEGVARLLPGAVGNPASTQSESFRDGLLEEPQYTRPARFREWDVPDVLLSGDHGRVAEWRRQQRIARTRARRPDLLPPGLGPDDDEG